MMRETTKYTVLVGLGNTIGVSPREALRTLTSIAEVTLPGFTITKAKGYWNGTVEHSVQVMVLTDDSRGRVLVEAFAKDVRDALDQAEVWYTEEPVLLRIVKGV